MLRAAHPYQLKVEYPPRDISSELELFERCFGHQLCMFFRSVGLKKIKKLWTEFI